MCVRRPEASTLFTLTCLLLSSPASRALVIPVPLAGMLTLYKDSICDVCLDSYTVEREPYAIACGHVFCLSCMNSLERPYCPLCRAPIRGVDLRRLHVDKTNLPLTTPQSPPAELDSADRARQFQTQISRLIREGATASDWHEMHAELKSWLATQDPGAIFEQPIRLCIDISWASSSWRMSSDSAQIWTLSSRRSVKSRPSGRLSSRRRSLQSRKKCLPSSK
ncbi:hypothetical protein PYCCODRAFT_377232 [Trametes coccinea BRFM310]|uniref:RING-type domain-containing protein n=1 Tax=Trametes coccinea (strain BRFM310) TaxID=1353009 RepID=A0A1Y2J3S7_TRAC3|nr:hypothetical protein PYCCODRAFT_377232 [Trametes coccinea BRFM310]